jgi:hypothetical protein
VQTPSFTWSGLCLLLGLALTSIAPALRAQSSTPPPLIPPGYSTSNDQFIPASKTKSLCITTVSPVNPADPTLVKPYAVIVRAKILKTGAVVPLYATAGPPAARDAAMNAVRLWTFHPYVPKVQTDPIEITTEITVPFVPGQPAGMIAHPPR